MACKENGLTDSYKTKPVIVIQTNSCTLEHLFKRNGYVKLSKICAQIFKVDLSIATPIWKHRCLAISAWLNKSCFHPSHGPLLTHKKIGC